MRIYYFFKFINFFKKNGYNKNLILKIFLNNNYYLWLLFLENFNLNYYYKLLKKILLKYRSIITNNYNNLITYNNIITPSHFLNYNNLNYTENIKINYNKFKIFIKNNSNIKNLNINKFLITNKNKTTIHFIRVQRRYNKRRYSKVRVVSRPSFFAGISLSSIMLALLWNGSIKSIDWLTAWIIVIDVNFILFVFILYYFYRLYRIYYINIFIRKRGKIKIINSLNLLLTNFLLKYIFK